MKPRPNYNLEVIQKRLELVKSEIIKLVITIAAFTLSLGLLLGVGSLGGRVILLFMNLGKVLVVQVGLGHIARSLGLGLALDVGHPWTLLWSIHAHIIHTHVIHHSWTWAETYDDSFGKGWGYVAPQRIAEIFLA